MDNMFDEDFFDDDLFADSAECSPITKAELEEAYLFDTLVESTTIKLVARIEEDREGDARTTTEQTITGDGPVVFSTEVFSMDRLLWADGVMLPNKTDKAGTTTAATKATFAVFKVNLESHTKSSGSGQNKAVQSARIQVEFHGTGPDADTVRAQRPVVVGWAPFATAEKSNMTKAEKTRIRSMRAGLQAGASQAKGTIEGTASSKRVWTKSYFDVNRSRPVSILGSTGESSNYNGVRWEMEHNRLAGEGVKPELLLCLLVTRQDDREYSVKITANVDNTRLLGHKEHKCVLRVTPRDPDNDTEPAVCYLQGKKMWQKLDVDHFEALLSPNMDSSLRLPWDLEDMAGTEDAKSGKSGAAAKNTKAGTKNGKDPENEAAEDRDGEDDDEDDDGNDSEGGDGDASESNRDENEGAAEAEPNATLTAAVSFAKERSEGSADEKAPRPARRQYEVALLDDPAVMLDTLLGLSAGGSSSHDKDEEDVTARMEMLESRMELMEFRMARQALLIRALLKHRRQ
ncbi:hypothetical protein Sste5346_003793 [Sporothrix stenoceras]|uniref:Uncharacterized protein n=1 Tax=Sporothrix stenoceras TaxID=5173 RepID=A0ABR3ZCZ7_9PEZI